MDAKYAILLFLACNGWRFSRNFDVLHNIRAYAVVIDHVAPFANVIRTHFSEAKQHCGGTPNISYKASIDNWSGFLSRTNTINGSDSSFIPSYPGASLFRRTSPKNNTFALEA